MAQPSAGRSTHSSASQLGAQGEGGCFVKGKPVLTDKGFKPINEVKKGDKVWSRDPKTGKFGWKTVTDTIVHHDRTVMRLVLLDGHGHTDVLGVTGIHPFWVKNHGWTKAEDLLPGDEIFTSRGGWVKVGSASWTAHTQTVYNLEVGGFHTYFVGDVGAWVDLSCADFVREVNDLPADAKIDMDESAMFDRLRPGPGDRQIHRE